MPVYRVGLCLMLFQSVICFCRQGLAANTHPHSEGLTRNLGPNPTGLTILQLWVIDSVTFTEMKNSDSRREACARHECRHPNMWHSKRPASMPLLARESRLEVSTLDHKIVGQRCQDRSRYTGAGHFCQTAGEPPCVSPFSERGKAVPCGGKPATHRLTKESVEWQMASEPHVLDFFAARFLFVDKTIRA